MSYKPSNPNGQASSANSEPVVIAGDQSAIPVSTIGTSVTPGTSAAHLGKADDAVHASGDTGVLGLLVRADTPATTAGATGRYGPGITDSLGAQWVHVVQSTVRIEVDSAGLTTAATAYTTGDQLGTELTFASAASVPGWGGVIVGASLLDKALKVNTGDIDLYLFKAASTPVADNTAADWSDANMANFVAVIRFPVGDWRTQPSNAINSQQNLSLGYGCSATSLFGALVTRQGNAVFAAVTDLRVTLHVVRD